MNFRDEIYIEAMKEVCCIEDYLEVVKVHVTRSEFELAIERCKDVQNSIKKIIQLDRKLDNQQRFANIIKKLSAEGILIEAVKRVEN